MPSEDRDAAHLWDMLQSARKTIRAVEGKSLEDYLQNEDLRLLVERRLEILGEAARRPLAVPPDVLMVEHDNVPAVPPRWLAQGDWQ